MSSTDEKLMKLVARLNEKSKGGEVAWEPSAANESQFIASFPGYSVAIQEAGGGFDRVSYFFSILDGTGNKLESIEASENERWNHWPKVGQDLLTLYTEARRRALNVEQALDNLLKAL